MKSQGTLACGGVSQPRNLLIGALHCRQANAEGLRETLAPIGTYRREASDPRNRPLIESQQQEHQR